MIINLFISRFESLFSLIYKFNYLYKFNERFEAYNIKKIFLLIAQDNTCVSSKWINLLTFINNNQLFFRGIVFCYHFWLICDT